MEFERIASDLETALQILKSNSSITPGQLRFVQRPLALALERVCRKEEALNLMAEVAATSYRVEKAGSPIVRSDYTEAFEMAKRHNNYEAALTFYEVLEELPASAGAELADSFDFVIAGAYCHSRLENRSQSAEYADRALKMIEAETTGEMKKKRLSALHLLGRLKREENLIEEAIEFRLRELAILEGLFGENSPVLLSVLDLLIEHYGTLKRMDEMNPLVTRRRQIKRVMDS